MESKNTLDPQEETLRQEIRHRVLALLLLAGVSAAVYVLLMARQQDSLRALEYIHQLDQQSEYLLRTIYEHVGNFPYGALLLPLLVGLADVFSLTFVETKRKISREAKIGFIIALFAILLTSNHDAENGQHSPLSFGTPQPLDEQAGIGGAVAGVAGIYTYSKSRKKRIRLASETTKRLLSGLHHIPRRYTAAQGI